jgi:cupin fold WbuC family metalloprotein
MTSLCLITATQLDDLSREAAESPRRRRNLNVHPQLDDPIQRLFNAIEPGTYVRPHRHARDSGWELMMAARGAFAVLTFGEDGRVAERIELDGAGGAAAVEIPSWTWHVVVVLEPGTIMFEVKPGPYSPMTDRDFAAWAPLEGDAAAVGFVRWYEHARPGDHPPSYSRSEAADVPAADVQRRTA